MLFKPMSLILLILGLSPSVGGEMARPLIFPAPREMTAASGDFLLNDQVTIAVPASPSEQDLFLANFLTNELGDRFDLHLKTTRAATLPPGRTILIGSVSNPLVHAYCATHKVEVSASSPGHEGYVLQTLADHVLIAGSDDQGAFYGLQSLRQLLDKQGSEFRIKGVTIRDWPDKPFRGVKLYLPGRNNIPFFKRFIRDFMALYKYNTLIMEMGASMRLERHPELNNGWEDFGRDILYSRRNYPPGSLHDIEQNSSHFDIADGGFLEKEEVLDLANWVKRYHIELVPELPAFTHSYHLLSRHKDLAEVPGNKWPDTYCPSNPKSYELLFDVYDEYIDLLKPRLVHAGHDELFMPLGVCPLCKDKDIGERYGEDVRRIHDYLAGKGVHLAIWGDMLLEGIRGKGPQKRKAPDGWAYNVAGGMTPEQVERLIPKDILIYNWFWNNNEAQAEQHEARLEQMGFRQIFGNFTADIQNYDARRIRKTLLGGAPSAWFATSEFGFGKDLILDFLGCSNILWSGVVVQRSELSGMVQAMIPEVRTRLRGESPPSATEPTFESVNIASAFNMGSKIPSLDADLSGFNSPSVAMGKVVFSLGTNDSKNSVIVGTKGSQKSDLPDESAPIPIGADPTSLIFLHASAKPAANREMFRVLWDPEDTADLLGWYEVVYQDGFKTTIPIRYGVNIEEWNWGRRPSAKDYCYGADAVPLWAEGKNATTFFAFEWKNPRIGKVIREIRLKGTTSFQGASADFVNEYGPVIPSNAVLLKAITVVKKRG